MERLTKPSLVSTFPKELLNKTAAELFKKFDCGFTGGTTTCVQQNSHPTFFSSCHQSSHTTRTPSATPGSKATPNADASAFSIAPAPSRNSNPKPSNADTSSRCWVKSASAPSNTNPASKSDVAMPYATSNPSATTPASRSKLASSTAKSRADSSPKTSNSNSTSKKTASTAK